MKYHIDIKLVYETRDINETHIKLKNTLKQITNNPGLDVFIKEPITGRYDRVTQ